MKKKIALLLVVLATTLTASAQFEQGKKYVGASLTGLNLSYNGMDKFNLGVQGQGGYFIIDNILAMANVGYNGNGELPDALNLGVGGRYYIIQNGIFLGANVQYTHANSDYNDVMPGVEVGYAFFINRYVTIEPALYYQQSFKDHSNYSTVGLKIGLGIYLP